MSILAEMKRRKVLRSAFLYLVLAWLLLQITDVVGPILDLPAWVAKLVFFLLLGGLPVMLLLAWQFDFTSLGIYRESPFRASGDNSAAGRGEQNLSRAVECIACLWVVFVGTGLSVGAAAVIHLHEVRMIENQFDLMAKEIAHEIGHRLTSNSEALKNLGAIFGGDQKPDLRSFEHTSEQILAESEGIIAIEWVPLVTHDDRASFVAEMRNVYPGFEIKSFDKDGEEIVSEQREVYFPVSYTVPRIGNEMAIGFDLLSNPDREAALNAAIVSGRTSQSKMIRLVQSGEMGLLIFNPVFRDPEVPVSRSGRLESLKSFTLGVIDIKALVASAIAASPGAANFVGEIILREAGKGADLPMVRIDSGNGSELSASTRAAAEVDGSLGGSHVLEIRPTRALLVGKFSSEHYIVGAVGILLSFICAVIMNAILTSRTMPRSGGNLAEVPGEGLGGLSPDPRSGHEDLPDLGTIGKHRNLRPSSW